MHDADNIGRSAVLMINQVLARLARKEDVDTRSQVDDEDEDHEEQALG